MSKEEPADKNAARNSALRTGRPAGTTPGWTVWHDPSGTAVIQAVRYRRDAEAARLDLLLITGIDWARAQPLPPEGSPHRKAYSRVYAACSALRERQRANSPYWSRQANRGRQR